MSDLEDVVRGVLRSHGVRTTRVGGGAGGAAVSVTELIRVVANRTGDEVDLEARLDNAVRRLHGQRINYADSAGYRWRMRRFFGRSVKRREDMYSFPPSLAPPPYDHPF
jgi:hypothetical protein